LIYLECRAFSSSKPIHCRESLAGGATRDQVDLPLARIFLTLAILLEALKENTLLLGIHLIIIRNYFEDIAKEGVDVFNKNFSIRKVLGKRFGCVRIKLIGPKGVAETCSMEAGSETSAASEQVERPQWL
jgi:hypothetical protein